MSQSIECRLGSHLDILHSREVQLFSRAQPDRSFVASRVALEDIVEAVERAKGDA